MDRDDPTRWLDLPVPAQPHPYLATMARFTNAPEHGPRRRAVLDVLPSPDGLEAAARERTETLLHDRLDVMPVLMSVPVSVLADRMGCADVGAEISLLCDEGVVSEGLPDVARTSILFQCRDATAALAAIGLTEAVTLESAVPVLRTRRDGVGWVPLTRAPFGAGDHACPGRLHALALARGMLAALAGHEVVDEGHDLGRPNLRLPAYLYMQRRAR
ncbi:MAG TPA: hypothetical protein VMD28_00140 [Acidimicrobiales bacterium]|nr:hypothetical protein [Acidimicrobiales bacterium]